MGSRTKAVKRLGLALLAAAPFTLVVTVWNVVRPPTTQATSTLFVHDVTQLNPIHVGTVITPTTTQEIIASVTRHGGPISVGGARHSMGGQIATAGALHIDMRGFDKILAFSRSEKTITVQAGTRWRQIQERIDPSNLSVSIMQT
jgi:FAD/FMN-containing dehydrogenase